MTIVEWTVVRCHCACHEPPPINLPSRSPCARCAGKGRLLWRATDDEREVEVMQLPEGWSA
ncbi:MAG TPA: hypothetical protein VNW68_05175 [Candidatus Limnocylindria bacterium]|nr:hypothetical protein [Candidatus Limnocylindria bacterium]